MRVPLFFLGLHELVEDFNINQKSKPKNNQDGRRSPSGISAFSEEYEYHCGDGADGGEKKYRQITSHNIWVIKDRNDNHLNSTESITGKDMNFCVNYYQNRDKDRNDSQLNFTNSTTRKSCQEISNNLMYP